MCSAPKRRGAAAPAPPSPPPKRASRVPPTELSTEAAERVAARAARRKHPHAARRAAILRDHPGVARLFGTHAPSAAYAAALVALQTWLALRVARGAPAWAAAVLAYVVGATVDHALFVLIHDATHNLVFKSAVGNRIVLLLCNLPHVFPSAMSFRYYHILHHIELNRVDDPDHPFDVEARLVGNSPLMKSLWLAFFFIVQALRTAFYTAKIPKAYDVAWMLTNGLCNGAYAYGVYRAAGPGGLRALAYLLASVIASIGLHPLGARWIQEHYPTQPFQATYSYYGKSNLIAFNIGYHVEHHDFPSVPWASLPALRAAAAPYYDTLFSYTSYAELLRDFIFQRKWNLADRIAVERDYAAAVAAGHAAGSDAFTHKKAPAPVG